MQLELLGFWVLFCFGFFYLQVFTCECKAVATALRAVLVVLSHPPESSEHTLPFLHALELTVTSY